MKRIHLILLAALIGVLANLSYGGAQEDAETFLTQYETEYQKLYYASSLAQWDANTRIVEGDDSAAEAAKKAEEELSAFTGSEDNINAIRRFLEKKEQLKPLQIRQLEKALYMAANAPQTVPALVKERIAYEVELTKALFGFDFQIDGKPVSTNDIDRTLWTETDLEKRLAAWKASKEVGKELKQGLATVRDLRNQTVQALGYDDYFTYQVSDYGISRDEMMKQLANVYRDIYPLFRELHTYARHELAKRYGADQVPDYLPAHWLPNRWGQDWGEMISVEGLDLTKTLAEKEPEFLVKQSERFYVSMGFEPLPKSFYELSSLYPAPADAKYKKNNHASAWHLDLDHDVRSLMSVESNASWYETTHHELGHVYYDLEYSTPEVPLLLRDGANRAFHEAVGSLLGLASMQQPFIQHIGLLPEDAKVDPIQTLLKEAMNYVVFIPFSIGLMSHFEHDLYAKNLPMDQFNQRWWELKKMFQGIAPPEERGEAFCDAASKTHIINDAAQYYDYALSFVLLFQLHEHIATEILKQDVHATNYYGNKEVGEFLHKLLSPGASRDWQDLLEEAIGEREMSAKAMLNYFEPLMDYLKEQNQGRKHALPETPAL